MHAHSCHWHTAVLSMFKLLRFVLKLQGTVTAAMTTVSLVELVSASCAINQAVIGTGLDACKPWSCHACPSSMVQALHCKAQPCMRLCNHGGIAKILM